MSDTTTSKASACDRYIDYRRFAIAVTLSVGILMIPVPHGMLDAAVEYQMGETYVLDHYSQELSDKPHSDVGQRELLTVRALESCMIQGASRKATVLSRDIKDLEKMGIEGYAEHFERLRVFVDELGDFLQKPINMDKLGCRTRDLLERGIENGSLREQTTSDPIVSPSLYTIKQFVSEQVTVDLIAPRMEAVHLMGLAVHSGYERPAELSYIAGLFTGVNARASHAVGLPDLYGINIANSSGLAEPGSGTEFHPELFFYVTRSSKGIDVRSDSDEEKCGFRYSVGLSRTRI